MARADEPRFASSRRLEGLTQRVALADVLGHKRTAQSSRAPEVCIHRYVFIAYFLSMRVGSQVALTTLQDLTVW
jgi:hypothetical protein